MRILVIVPFPLDETGIDNRRVQVDELAGPSTATFTFKPVSAGPELMDSVHDWLYSDMALFEAGLEAEAEGFDAVCVDSMSDSGVDALRSVLRIPVIGPGRASFLTALMLGDSFSVITTWEPWVGVYAKILRDNGLEGRCKSIRALQGVPPDFRNLLQGKEDSVFPKLLELSRECIDQDGADVICLGSTTMHQAHAYLTERLEVPVINPGPLTYKLAEAFLTLGLSQSRKAYPRPGKPKHAELHRMFAAVNQPSN